MTLGLPPSPSHPWRLCVPSSVTELRNMVREYSTLHLVGHYSEETNTLHIGQELTISVDAITAIPIRGPRNIIVSACDPGGVAIEQNIAVSLSANSSAAIWTPSVAVRQDHVEDLDVKLGQYHGTVAEFMKPDSQKDKLLYLYVRYGLN